jgi:hypothetical protein
MGNQIAILKLISSIMILNGKAARSLFIVSIELERTFFFREVVTVV